MPFSVNSTIPIGSLSALAPLRDQGYFSPLTKKRVVVLITDGESGPYEAQALAQTLVGPDYTDPGPGEASVPSQPPISLFIIRVGDTRDRIYRSNGSIEAAYRPDPRTSEILSTLAAATGAQVFDTSHLSAASRELRGVIGSGQTAKVGEETKTRTLAPFVVLAALAAVVVIVRKRNLVSI